MPNCFQLVSKETGKSEILQRVDDKMRVHFGAPADPNNWFFAWYDSIGFGIAMGQTFATLRILYREEAEQGVWLDCPKYILQQTILDWLDARYTTDAWAEIGRR